MTINLSNSSLGIEISQNQKYVFISEENRSIFRFSLNLQKPQILDMNSKIEIKHQFKTYFDSSFEPNHNGKFVLGACISKGFQVGLFRPEQNRQTYIFSKSQETRCLQIHHKLNIFIVAGVGDVIQSGDLRSLKMLQKKFVSKTRDVNNLKIFKDFVVYGTQRNSVYVFKFEKKRLKKICEFNFGNNVFALAWCPIGKYVYVGGWKKQIQRFKVDYSSLDSSDIKAEEIEN